ncbi:RNA polymerase I-specific transcription initiation factor rrn5 [Escovopsis weberi]|uniref:RNA polymerase I-specific transcription initiation factor rrn5 n=1 Tax=Escovopsis weberi TaxID=150374 RepID=A0A0M8N076_ESCWE|nr:RNA polymerase I-specific transcription initiation factor rrn5 [Escovopsis weberi]
MAASPRPFKRRRGKLNLSYLELLNRDIEDAARRTVLDDPGQLHPSQIGLTHWSSFEKHAFFEALARLGKTELSAISAAVGTKSTVEVGQYVSLLQEARDQRHDSEKRPVLGIYEYPAAVEVSQQCVRAQEEAADEIHLRQEAREEQRERKRWNEIWDVTTAVARKFDKQLFHTSRWLELSRRLFMNSSIPSSNWHFVEDEPPSVWATAFEDFHSLAISITRRLVQTTLFMVMSRIKTRRATNGSARGTIKLQDVEAAVSSLGMASNLDEKWIQCARRLRLHVYEDPPEMEAEGEDIENDEEGEEEEEDPMTYDEIERRLSGIDQDDNAVPSQSAVDVKEQPYSDEEEEHDTSAQASDSSQSSSADEDLSRDINQEADEVFIYAAAGIRQDKAAKQALKARIASERYKDWHANEWDEHASYKAELELWDILQKKPPALLPKKPDPGLPKRSIFDVEGIYPAGRDWLQRLEYYSEWESIQGQQQQQGKEDDEEDDDEDNNEGGH